MQKATIVGSLLGRDGKMVTIRLREYKGAQEVKLDAWQIRLFLRELQQTKRYLPSHKKMAPKIAQDLEVVIRTGRKEKIYRLYGQAMLKEDTTGKYWQFYFGLLLLEWLFP